MSLSKTIIYGSSADVQNALNVEPELNVIDEYGYTPLIESIIVDDNEKTELLLNAGADANQKDITGRTPLHWAISNNNETICQQLLQQGANPNAYNIASEPILVKAVLRNHTELKELLAQQGASYQFAHDYINMKLLGHGFELTGSVDIVDPSGIFTEVDYEGFYLEFCLDLINYSLENFRNNFAARPLSSWFDQIDKISKTLSLAQMIIQHDHYLSQPQQQKESIAKLLKHDPVIVPISQEGHAITLVKSKNLLAICDRAVDMMPDENITICYMNKPTQLTVPFLAHLVYKKQDIKTINAMLKTQLGLVAIDSLPMRAQVIGNCSWANVEAAIPVLAFMLQTNIPGNTLSKDEIATDSLELFYRWKSWETQRTLHFMIHEFYPASPARKASLAAALAAILFQKCSADDSDHVDLAKRIIAILRTKGYEYILDSYLQFYGKSKNTKAGENLKRLLHIYEVEEAFV